MSARSTLLSLIAAFAVVLSVHAAGQAPPAGVPASADGPPRRADGKPDLTGVWMPPYVPDMTVNRRDQRGYAEAPFSPDDTPQARQALAAKGNKADLPFTAWGLANWSSYDAASGDYTGSCFPFGLQRAVNAPYPFQIMQDERHVALLFEINTWHHVIPIAREFPKQAADNPTWYGYSIGRWEGDTFVVETRGFNGFTRLDTVGHPHSDALRLTQTFTRLDRARLAYRVTVDDPKTYTKPWTNERTLRLMDGPLLEYSCEENNRGLWEGRIKGWTPPWSKPQ
ncbi:MAG TPA: hypothetical protein VNN99_05850 [Vicinamibacterales bacterium]|nr:hypothetical protein [Vicinamibacterales bacterium]